MFCRNSEYMILSFCCGCNHRCNLLGEFIWYFPKLEKISVGKGMLTFFLCNVGRGVFLPCLGHQYCKCVYNWVLACGQYDGYPTSYWTSAVKKLFSERTIYLVALYDSKWLKWLLTVQFSLVPISLKHHQKVFISGLETGKAEAVMIVSLAVRQQVGHGRRLRLL